MPSSIAWPSRRCASDRIVDTLVLARRRHPAGPNSLDALCKRYGVDNSERTKHGALVDSLLLAVVYVELLGERQATLGLGGQSAAETARACRRARPSRGRRLCRFASASRRRPRIASSSRPCGPDALWLRYLAVPQSLRGWSLPDPAPGPSGLRGAKSRSPELVEGRMGSAMPCLDKLSSGQYSLIAIRSERKNPSSP